MVKGNNKIANQEDCSMAKTRLGIRLFIFYTLVYAGFVVINTIWPKTMGLEVLWGLNLAVVYGFGLILFAIILGLIFHSMCNKLEESVPQSGEGEGS